MSVEMNVSNTEMVVHIKNNNPIELLDFTQSMTSLAIEYNDFAKSDDLKLYIKEVKSGSIIATLFATAPALLPFMEFTNTVLDFTFHIRHTIDFLKGEREEKPHNLTINTLNNIKKLVEPIAKDNGSVLIIDNLTVSGNNNIVNINSLEANAIQNRANKELENMKEPIASFYTQMILYFSQARSDNKQGDKGIIEFISKREVKVAFDNQELKSRMIIDVEHNIFDKAYIVDVKVQTVKDKPVLYTVTDFYEMIDIE